MADQMDDIAGRIVLIVDASVPAAARAACDDAAAALAQRAGMPVTLAAVPIETLEISWSCAGWACAWPWSW